MALLSPLGPQFFDNLGAVAALGKLYTYATGTTTPVTSYQDQAGTIPHTNPIILDSAGKVQPELWLTAGTEYRLRLTTSADVLIDEWDDIGGIPSSADLSATSGAGLVGYSGAVSYPTSTVGWMLTKMMWSLHDPRWGLALDGVTDDSAAINAALSAASAAGRHLYCFGATAAISSTIIGQANTGIHSDGTFKLYAKAAGFTNVDPATHYTSASTVIDLSGQTTAPYTPKKGQQWSGVVVQFESTNGRCVDGIVARNAQIVLTDIELYNFNKTRGILYASLAAGSKIIRPYIHDFTSDYVWPGYGYAQRAEVNITGIDGDDDNINSVESVVDIIEPRIENLNHGATAIAVYGNQADCINWQKGKVSVIRPYLRNSSEAIDCFGDYAVIRDVDISDMTEFGIKFIHTGSYGSVRGGKISRCGLAGIDVVGGDIAFGAYTECNVFEDISITDIDPNNLNSNTACVRVENAATGAVARKNTFRGLRLNPGTYGEYAIINNSSGDVNNVFDRNEILAAGTLGTYLMLAANNFEVIPTIATKVQVTRSSAQAIATGAAAKVTFNSAVIDTLSEFDITTNNRWVCTHPGYYFVDFQVAIALCRGLYAHIYKNGSAVATVAGVDSATDVVQAGFNRFLVYMSVADYLEGWVQHASGSNRNITAGVANTSFTVVPA